MKSKNKNCSYWTWLCWASHMYFFFQNILKLLVMTSKKNRIISLNKNIDYNNEYTKNELKEKNTF